MQKWQVYLYLILNVNIIAEDSRCSCCRDCFDRLHRSSSRHGKNLWSWPNTLNRLRVILLVWQTQSSLCPRSPSASSVVCVGYDVRMHFVRANLQWIQPQVFFGTFRKESEERRWILPFLLGMAVQPSPFSAQCRLSSVCLMTTEVPCWVAVMTH